MSPRTLAWVMAGAVVVYLLLLGQAALALLREGGAMGTALGAAILVFPVLGAWVLWREMRFGYAMQAMARSWQSDGGEPETISFESARARAGAQPDQWQSWFELGLAYDAEGDRRRARQAMRRAATLFA